MIKKISSSILFLLLICFKISAQETDIVPALQEIERGNFNSAEDLLQQFKTKNPNDPSIVFLDAVLTKDGAEALKKYSAVLEKHPGSKYADASLYRIFSYYYSLGFYKKAETYLSRLKKDFHESPYIKAADRKIPDVDDSVDTSEPLQNKPAPVEKHEPENYNFTIQAGAFLNVDNANKLIEKLKAENFSTEITTREVGGSILNIVNVGKFMTNDEAKPVLSILENKYNLKGRIIPRTKK